MRNCIDVERRYESVSDIASIINECIWYYRHDYMLWDVCVAGETLRLRFIRVLKEKGTT